MTKKEVSFIPYIAIVAIVAVVAVILLIWNLDKQSALATIQVVDEQGNIVGQGTMAAGGVYQVGNVNKEKLSQVATSVQCNKQIDSCGLVTKDMLIYSSPAERFINGNVEPSKTCDQECAESGEKCAGAIRGSFGSPDEYNYDKARMWAPVDCIDSPGAPRTVEGTFHYVGHWCYCLKE